MNDITITLTDRERTRLWLLLRDAAADADRYARSARTDERRERCVADVDLLQRVAEAVR